MKLSIYRYDPEKDEKPYMKDYDVALDHADRMLLDALVKAKAMDDSLSFRRSRDHLCLPYRPALWMYICTPSGTR